MRWFPPSWLVRWALTSACVLVLAGTLVVVTRALAGVLTLTASVVAAVLLTALLEPAASALRNLRFPAWLASLLVVLATLGVLAATVGLLVTRAQAQGGDLQGAVTEGLDRLRRFAEDLPLPISDRRLEQGARDLADGAVSALPSPAAGAGMATRVLSGVLLALFTWFFLLKDGRTMWAWAVRWAPSRRREGVDAAGRATWEVLTGYVRGTTVIATADALGIGLAMLVLGVPLAASLTVLVFLGAFVPIVGSVVAGSLACLVTLVALGPVEALILLGCVLLVQQLEGNLLQPLVMGRVLQLHPLVVVLVVAAGTSVAGILGALVAVPVVAVAYRLALMRRRDAGTDPGSGPASEPGPAGYERDDADI